MIKRVPTVVSNYQEEEAPLGCGRNCLGRCCLPGTYFQNFLDFFFKFGILRFLVEFYVMGILDLACWNPLWYQNLNFMPPHTDEIDVGF